MMNNFIEAEHIQPRKDQELRGNGSNVQYESRMQPQNSCRSKSMSILLFSKVMCSHIHFFSSIFLGIVVGCNFEHVIMPNFV
jgi:hypothetical protein